MTLKEKISKVLIVGGLVGALGGFAEAIYTVAKLSESPALSRMYQVEDELAPITGLQMVQNPRLKDKYLALEGEYETFRSKPLVMQERSDYESAQNMIGLYYFCGMAGLAASMIGGFAFMVSQNERKNKVRKPMENKNEHVGN